MADLKAHLGEYLRGVEQGPVIITRNGKPVAALVLVTDEEDLERLAMAHSPKLQAILVAARERFREGKGIPHEIFWQQVAAEAASEVRQRRNGRKRLPRRPA